MDRPVLVDSNVFITILRQGKDPSWVLTERYDSTDLLTCGIVRLEVLRGVRGARAKEQLTAFFDVMMNVPSDNSLWDEAVALAWNLDRAGQVIPATDILIAASAFRAGGMVLTQDRHFHVVPKLEVLDFDL
jgi:predicted nucleic acid-binding protein